MEADPELVEDTAKVVDLDAEDDFGDLGEIDFDKGRSISFFTLIYIIDDF